MEIIKLIKSVQDLRTEFNKDIATLRRTQIEMKAEVENLITQLENSK